MGLYKYAFKTQDEKKVARAQAFDLDASYKDLTEIARAIKGKTLEKAQETLDNAINEKKAIPYQRFAKGTGHKSNIGGKRGRYPKKECKIVKSLLLNCKANAEVKGLDLNTLYIQSAIAYKQNVYPRYRRFWASGATIGYGKQSTMSNYATARIELTLTEKPNAKKQKEKKEATKKEVK